MIFTSLLFLGLGFCSESSATDQPRFRPVLYGYDDCSNADSISRSLNGCGIAIPAFSCDDLNSGGQICLDKCMNEERCDFFSIIFDKNTDECRCSMRTTESLIASSRVVSTAEHQMSTMDSFFCDKNRINDLRSILVPNCDGDTGCAFQTSIGYTVAKRADDWSLVDTCKIKVNPKVLDRVKKSRAKSKAKKLSQRSLESEPDIQAKSADSDSSLESEPRVELQPKGYDIQAKSADSDSSLESEPGVELQPKGYDIQAKSADSDRTPSMNTETAVEEGDRKIETSSTDKQLNKLAHPDNVLIVNDNAKGSGKIIFPRGVKFKDLMEGNSMFGLAVENGPGLFGHGGTGKPKQSPVKKKKFPSLHPKLPKEKERTSKEDAEVHNVTETGKYTNVTGDIHDVITANFTDAFTFGRHTGSDITWYNTATDNGCPADCPCKCKKKGTCDCEIEVDIEVEAVIDVNMPDCSDNDKDDCGGGCNGKKFKSD